MQVSLKKNSLDRTEYFERPEETWEHEKWGAGASERYGSVKETVALAAVTVTGKLF